MSYGWPKYVPVAQRKAKAEKAMKKLIKQGHTIEPVNITGRSIATTFWGKNWCRHLEQFSDYSNRLPRGRSYARNGSVCHLAISKGNVEAIVSGSKLYQINIRIKPLPRDKWQQIRSQSAGQISSVLELLQGKFSKHIMTLVTNPQNGLFPLPKEISLNCNCPDGAHLCKHLAAVLYGIGARLDQQPELLFTLRSVDEQELITEELSLNTESRSGRKKLPSQQLSAIFDIELEERVDVEQPTSSNVQAAKDFEPTPANIKQLRQKQLGMTLKDFALLLNVSTASISRWEKSQSPLTLQQRIKGRLQEASQLTAKQARARLP